MRLYDGNVFEYIKSDCFRYTCKTDLLTIIRLYISSSTFRWQVAYRMCCSKTSVKFIGKVLMRINRQRQFIRIPPQTQIGYGLYIAHGGYVVVNSSAVIGNNCNLSQFVTIGSNSGNAAHIGNNVYIGPGVCIVEDVSIGNNVTIGAGAIVTKNLPDNATAIGNYAKVINYNNPGRFIKNEYKTKNE